MQIIFDEKLVPELRQKYVVLELDTVMQPQLSEPVTLYALIENLDVNDIMTLNDRITQHQLAVDAYKQSNWAEAKSHAAALKGSWKSEIDEFYDLVIAYSDDMLEKNATWDGIRHTSPVE